MTQETAARISQIRNDLLTKEKYRDISTRFNQSINILQHYSNHFSMEQWTSLDNFIVSFIDFYESAIAIALNDEP